MSSNWFRYTPRAVRLHDIGGRRAFRFPVTVETVNTLSRDFDTVRLQLYVTAHTAADAANYVARLAEANTTVRAYGVRGGETVRFVGWDTYIGRNLFTSKRRAFQFDLFGGE